MSTTRNTDTAAAVFYKSPPGIARYPRTTVPDTRFDSKGVYSVGLVLTGAEMDAAADRLRVIFDTAFPGHTGDIKLPIRTDDAGERYLVAKSSYAPKILDEARKPLETVEHGARIKIVGRARPFSTFQGRGVALYLGAVDVLAPVALETVAASRPVEEDDLSDLPF